MALKQFNPTSPGQRGLVLIDRSELHKGKPEKKLVEGLTKSGGRGGNGRIAVRFAAAAPSACTVWSTSSVASKAWPRSFVLSTTPTAPPSSP